MGHFESVEEVLDFAIAREMESRDFYMKLAERMENHIGGFMGIRFDGGGGFGYFMAWIVNYVGGIYYDYCVRV